jgi:hypothetical protein
VIGVSCFVIAPPFRRHGIASALLDRVIADASGRGATWIEAYPLNKPEQSDAGHFRGPRSMYDARGFEPIKVREHDTVLQPSIDGPMGCASRGDSAGARPDRSADSMASFSDNPGEA